MRTPTFIRAVLAFCLGFSLPASFAQPFAIVNEKCLGGTSDDVLTRLTALSPTEIAAIGKSSSNNGVITLNRGLSDGWILKLDQQQNPDWSQTDGGPNLDELAGITVVAGGKVAVYGSGSLAGVINCTTSSDRDSYAELYDNAGNVLTGKCIGGTGDDFGIDIIEDPLSPVGKGFILTGHSRSSGTGAFINLTNMGFLDIFVARTDSLFNILNIRFIQSSGFDLSRAIKALPGGNFLLLAETDGNDGDMTGPAYGSDDVMVFELNNNFTILNKWRYGGINADHAYDLWLTSNAFVLSGTSLSPGFAGCTHNSSNAYVMKANLSGVVQWNTCIEGSGSESAQRGILGSGGNWFYSVGTSTSGDINFSSNMGGTDSYIAGLNYQTGSLAAVFSYGGPMNDEAYDIVELPNGQFLTANGSASGNAACGPYGLYDGWLVTIASAVGISERNSPVRLSIYPNPASGSVTVESNKSGTLCLSNAFGQRVIEIELPAGTQGIPLGSVASGIYAYQFQFRDGISSGQLIVLKN